MRKDARDYKLQVVHWNHNLQSDRGNRINMAQSKRKTYLFVPF